MNSQPGKTAKRVVFHIGFPKTGSSALQAFLSANAVALADSGVDFPYPDPDSVIAVGTCTGNLVQIMYRDGFVEKYKSRTNKRVTPRNVIDEAFFDRLKEIIEGSDHPTVLFSSEGMPSIPPTVLEHFKKAIFDVYDTQLIAFVRDPFDMVYSGWRHLLRVQRANYSLSDHVTGVVRRSRLPMTTDFAKLCTLGMQPTLVNYDTYKADIVGKFFEVAGIALPSSGTYKLSGENYNGSLTAAEAALVLMVSARFGNGDFAATLVKLLMKRPARERTSGSFYSAEVDEAILSAMRPRLEEINRHIIGEPLRTVVRSRPDSFPAPGAGEIACLLEAFDIAMRAAARPEARASVFAWAKGLFSSGDGLPKGFDPEAYLFHNEDVAGAGVDPRLHYLSYGSVEDRRYRYS